MGQVTNLKQYILDFVNAVRRRPATGSDPSELDNLENAALTSYDGAFAANTSPVAPLTWEARTLFLGANPISERVQLDIPFPCMIVGAYASVEPVGTFGVFVTATYVQPVVGANVSITVSSTANLVVGGQATVVNNGVVNNYTVVSITSPTVFVGTNLGGGSAPAAVIPVGSPVTSTPAFLIPTVNSLDVQIDLNLHEYMTNTQGTITTIPGGAPQKDGTFTTLGSWNVNTGGRLMGWVIPFRTAQLGVQFRWKQGGGIYQTSHVGLALYARTLQEQ